MQGRVAHWLTFVLFTGIARGAGPFERLRSFALDLGNRRVVNLPKKTLSRFVGELTAGVIAHPRYYAGAMEGSELNSLLSDDYLTRHPLLLEPHSFRKIQHLPTPAAVFAAVLERQGGETPDEVGLNMMLVALANWFLDEFFRTEPETNGTFYRQHTQPMDTGSTCVFQSRQHSGATPAGHPPIKRGGVLTSTMRLGQLYGTDPYREAALRTFSGGHLKVGAVPMPDGGQSMPSLREVRATHPLFGAVCGWNVSDETCLNSEAYFATGQDRFNFHPGHLMFNTIFLREHNELVDKLAAANGDWDDERLYSTARLLLVQASKPP